MTAPLINELKEQRQTLGWSVEELGERCSIDARLLGDWERGLASPPLDMVENWANALGMCMTLAAERQPARRGVRIDWEARVISVDGTPVRLTPMEWKALERLARVPGELVTHQALFRHLYGDEQPYRAQSTAIRVLITKLRRLLPLKIEARWGRGYVVGGIEPPAPGKPSGDGTPSDEAATKPPKLLAAVPAKPQRDSIALVPKPAAIPTAMPTAPRDGEPGPRERSETRFANVRRVAVSARRPSTHRAEELGVIEQFLAERGVTRCPDVATIQHSPLPTLVWDKIKRKWVRLPQEPGREAS